MATQATILIVGGSGQVGRALLARASQLQLQAISTTSSPSEDGLHLDLRDSSSILGSIGLAQPTHVILAAASTSVLGCEEDPAGTSAVNVGGTRVVAETCERIG